MEPPNKLMIMQVLGLFRYDSMILNGLMRISLGARCVIRGVLGKIDMIRTSDGCHGQPNREHRKAAVRRSGHALQLCTLEPPAG